MPTSIPKNGKLYWLKPAAVDVDEGRGVHYFRRWDAAKQRYQDSIEPAGMQPLTSQHQKIPAIPPRADGTVLKEGVGYEPIEIT